MAHRVTDPTHRKYGHLDYVHFPFGIRYHETGTNIPNCIAYSTVDCQQAHDCTLCVRMQLIAKAVRQEGEGEWPVDAWLRGVELMHNPSGTRTRAGRVWHESIQARDYYLLIRVDSFDIYESAKA